jgi:hypothetical protein
METVINNPNTPPSDPERENGWVGSLLIGIVVIILALLFFVFALPALRGTDPGVQPNDDININVDLPDQQDVEILPPTGGDSPATQ